jgi:hypothetical protein
MLASKPGGIARSRRYDQVAQVMGLVEFGTQRVCGKAAALLVAPSEVAAFAASAGDIVRMKDIVTNAIVAPMSTAIQMRVSEKETWPNRSVFRYIKTKTTTVDVAIIARDRVSVMGPAPLPKGSTK